MLSQSDSVASYIRAKDGNRPHLLDTTFTDDATLEMVVRADSISFPPSAAGRAAIAETLVRQFNQTYENIYTFCIGASPHGQTQSYSCGWLVAMSEKQGGAVRVGCGRYDWLFTRADHRVRALVITIEAMEVFSPEALPIVLNWVSALPYPWCRHSEAAAQAPGLPGISHVLQLLETVV